MVEVKIHNFAFAIDCKTGDVMSKIAVPAHALRIVCSKEITLIPKTLQVGILARELLTLALRINSDRPVVVAIPEADDEGHKEQRKDPVSLLDHSVR